MQCLHSNAKAGTIFGKSLYSSGAGVWSVSACCSQGSANICLLSTKPPFHRNLPQPFQFIFWYFLKSCLASVPHWQCESKLSLKLKSLGFHRSGWLVFWRQAMELGKLYFKTISSPRLLICNACQESWFSAILFFVCNGRKPPFSLWKPMVWLSFGLSSARGMFGSAQRGGEATVSFWRSAPCRIARCPPHARDVGRTLEK